jgi:hypothetical protein
MDTRKPPIFILLSLAFLIQFSGCKKDDPDAAIDYVQGEILFKSVSSASFEEIYDLVDSLGLGIKELNNRQYLFNGDTDSITVLSSIIDTKDYVAPGGITFANITSDSTATINVVFLNVDGSDYSDWNQVKTMFNLTENFVIGIQEWDVLAVPVGSEQLWVDQIVSYDIITSARLNQ